MLAYVFFALILTSGWLGWTYWLAIPLGYLFYHFTFRYRPHDLMVHGHRAWLLAPSFALLLMWLARRAQMWLG